MIMRRSNLGNTQEFWISDKFRIVAMSKFVGNDTYKITLYIDKKDIGILEYIMDFEMVASRELINGNISDEIHKLHSCKKFDKYMDNYNKMLKYLDQFAEEFEK